jgi:hypothetical protein
MALRLWRTPRFRGRRSLPRRLPPTAAEAVAVAEEKRAGEARACVTGSIPIFLSFFLMCVFQ